MLAEKWRMHDAAGMKETPPPCFTTQAGKLARAYLHEAIMP